MARFCFGVLLFGALFSACNSKSSSNGQHGESSTSVVTQLDTVDINNIPVLKEQVFDLAKLTGYFQYKNDLSKIPCDGFAFGQAVPPVILDTAAVKMIYQDTSNHYFPDDEFRGANRFYGYIDTFKNFNAVCMYTGLHDGGDLYDLITFTKSGKRIAAMELAWEPGEEGEWECSEKASVTGYEIKVVESNCHLVGQPDKMLCDTIRSYYRFKNDGEIVFVKGDSVLSPVLDSIRKVIQYN